jgi:hypothetical protein
MRRRQKVALGIVLGALLTGVAVSATGFLAHALWLQAAGLPLMLFGLAGVQAFVEGASRPSAEDRVARLVAALEESSTVIREIEREVTARRALAQRLQADVARHRELLNLNRDEVEAVAQTLRVEVQSEARRGFWLNFLLSALFFVLGVVATLVLSH